MIYRVILRRSEIATLYLDVPPSAYANWSEAEIEELIELSCRDWLDNIGPYPPSGPPVFTRESAEVSVEPPDHPGQFGDQLTIDVGDWFVITSTEVPSTDVPTLASEVSKPPQRRDMP